jgi:hypothetical protein
MLWLLVSIEVEASDEWTSVAAWDTGNGGWGWGCGNDECLF